MTCGVDVLLTIGWMREERKDTSTIDSLYLRRVANVDEQGPVKIVGLGSLHNLSCEGIVR